MGECGLYLGRREVGRLRWDMSGGKLCFFASCPAEPGLIYRVFLCTESGVHRLGVMLPEEDSFHLRRVVAAGLLPRRAIVDRTLPGEAHLPGLPLALSAFSREELPETLPAANGLLAAWWDQTCYLLYPFHTGESCESASFFSVSTVISYAGEDYGVFCWENSQCIPLKDRLRKGDMLK